MLKASISLFLLFLSCEVYSQSCLDLWDHEKEDRSSYKPEICKDDTCQTQFITGEIFCEKFKFNGKIVKEIKYYRNGKIKSYKAYFPGTHFEIDSSVYWYENGIKKETGKTLDGKFKVINFWDSTGALMVKEGSGKVISYYKDQVEFKGEYISGLKEGLWYYGYYLENSCEQGNYIKGKKDGEWILGKTNGTRILTEMYSDNNLIKGKRILENGDSTVYFDMQTEIIYPGGLSALGTDVRDLMGNINSYLERGKITRIIVSLTIGKDGKIEEPEVIQGKGTKLEEKLIEALKKSKPWTPALNRGFPVKRRVRIPFNF